LLNRLSVRLHDMIGGKNKDLVWNNGVVFQDKGLTAEVREIRRPDIGSRIDIKITGTDAHFMSERLIREVDKINELFNFERLKVYIHIPCICTKCKTSDAPHTYEFAKVKADLQKEDTKFHKRECDISRETVDYRELLKTISQSDQKNCRSRTR